jgi:hypothetical protein
MKMTGNKTQNAINSRESISVRHAAVEIGMEGMHTVWMRYGEGMYPPRKSFAIKYGGMSYRVEGAAPDKSKRQAAPAEHFSASFYHPAVFIL